MNLIENGCFFRAPHFHAFCLWYLSDQIPVINRRLDLHVFNPLPPLIIGRGLDMDSVIFVW